MIQEYRCCKMNVYKPRSADTAQLRRQPMTQIHVHSREFFLGY